MKKLKLSLLAAGTLAVATLPQVSLAVPITGSISFYGNVIPYVGTPSSPGAMASSYMTAQSLVFGLTQVAAGANGSFAGLATGTLVNVNALGVNPPTPPAPAGTPLWTVGSFVFTLQSLTEPVHTADFMVLQGNGTITDGNPADTTMGSWVATFTTATAGSGVTFSWNSSSAAFTNAPEAGTNVLLMGLGLAGLAAFAKFRKDAFVTLA